jgi:hypothetical protein
MLGSKAFCVAIGFFAVVSGEAAGSEVAPGENAAKCAIVKCEAGHFQGKDCKCRLCGEPSAGMFIDKHCDGNGNVKDHTYKACKICKRGFYATKKCTPYSNTVCTRCTGCCPVVGQRAAGVSCNAYNSPCGDNGLKDSGPFYDKDHVCGLPHDWMAFATTGANCGKRCGKATGEQYMSSNTTWAFLITDKQGNQVFQGLPNITNPATSLCPTNALGTKCTPVSLTQQPGLSSGFVPKTIVITPALNVPMDSWCMESFCMHSLSAGVKMEFNTVSRLDKKANEKDALWMNPLPSGPCGGKRNQWRIELVGPTRGKC